MTILILICLIVRYFLLIKFTKLRLYMEPDENLFTSGKYKLLLAEILINLIHTPPQLHHYISIPQRTAKNPAFVHIDVILIILNLFFRSYHILKYFSFHSRWYSYESEKLCMECHTPLDYLFSIKAEFKERPFLLLGVTMFLSIFIFGYSLRGMEMFFMASSGQDWRYYWNGMWCIIITMATVGFGDFFPVSVLGRVIVVIACFWGTFLISLMVAALTVAVEFNSQEAISYDSIKAAHFELEYGTEGTTLIQNAWKYRWLMQREDGSNTFKQKKSIQFQKLKKSIENFRKLRKNKNDSIEAMLIEYSVNKIEKNLTIEIDKIKDQLKIVDEIKALITEYSENQSIIKEQSLEVYRDLEELVLMKEKFN